MHINNFGPFEADTWGTVSDWAMVIVTTGTLYLIYKTLRSQTIVQQLQTQTASIENEKFRIQHMPRFVLTVTRSKTKHYLFDSDISYVLQFQLNEYDCRDFIATISKNVKTSNVGNITNGLHGEYVIGLTQQLFWVEINKMDSDLDILKFQFVTHCSYIDLIGNKYIQEFFVDVEDKEINVQQGQPIRVFK